MNKVKLTAIATIGILFFACGNKTETAPAKKSLALSQPELEANQELESEAKKWQDNVKTNRNNVEPSTTEGKYFSYKIKRREPSCTDCGDDGSVSRGESYTTTKNASNGWLVSQQKK